MLVLFRFSKNNKSCNIQAKNFVLNLKFFQILFFRFAFKRRSVSTDVFSQNEKSYFSM
jgi:hypothetical protein